MVATYFNEKSVGKQWGSVNNIKKYISIVFRAYFNNRFDLHLQGIGNALLNDDEAQAQAQEQVPLDEQTVEYSNINELYKFSYIEDIKINVG